ncbi:MAG: isoprenylcysteine carboxylmethyltransferase family protein [Candidatus Eisenbacteria bacterium]
MEAPHAEAPRPEPPRARSVWVGLLGAAFATTLDAALLALALGGVAALLAHPRALALLTVWFAGALILGSLRPVRGRAGTVRNTDPWLLLALFVLPMIAAPLSAWGERLGVGMLPGGEVRGWLGVLIAGLGLALRMRAMVQLGPRFDPTVAILPGHALETRGLYARIRHPGYAGAWIGALGGALTFGSAPGLAAVALMAAALATRVHREEKALAAHFGEAWQVYREGTGAFWPRPR